MKYEEPRPEVPQPFQDYLDQSPERAEVTALREELADLIARIEQEETGEQEITPELAPDLDWIDEHRFRCTDWVHGETGVESFTDHYLPSGVQVTDKFYRGFKYRPTHELKCTLEVDARTGEAVLIAVEDIPMNGVK